jgi:WD40 repeat protein
MKNVQQDIESKSKNTENRGQRQSYILIILVVTTLIFFLYGSVAFVQRDTALQQVSTAQAASTFVVAEREAALTIIQSSGFQQKTAQASAKDAQLQATISRANELAAQSLSLKEKDFQLSLLLGLEAYYKYDTFYTKSVLLDNIRANPQLQVYLNGHINEVRSATFSPDGSMLAAGGFDNTIFLWDVKTGQQIGPPLIGPQLYADAGHTGLITSLAFSPDGKVLAAGSLDTTIVLWDVKTGKLIGAPLTAHKSSIKSVVFSPDGNKLVSTTCDTFEYCGQYDDGKTIIWDMKTGQPFERIKTGSPNAAFSLDGNILALVGDEKNTIMLWDVKNRKINKKLQAPESVYKLIFFSDGRLASIVLRNYRYQMILWDINTGQQISSEPYDIGSSSYVFSSDGNTLINAYGSDIGQIDL